MNAPMPARSTPAMKNMMVLSSTLAYLVLDSSQIFAASRLGMCALKTASHCSNVQPSLRYANPDTVAMMCFVCGHRIARTCVAVVRGVEMSIDRGADRMPKVRKKGGDGV